MNFYTTKKINLIIILVLIACAQCKPKSVSPLQKQLIGSWQYLGLEYNDGETQANTASMQMKIRFGANGEFENISTIDSLTRTNKLTYTLRGDSLFTKDKKFSSTEEGSNYLLISQLDEELLQLTNQSEGVTINMRYRRIPD